MNASHNLFSTLRSARIISTLQLRQAQAHPGVQALASDASLGAQLAWLVEHGIVGRGELQQAEQHVAATYGGDDRVEYEKAIAAGLHRADEVDAAEGALLDVLVAEDLITPAERTRAGGRVPAGVCAMTPAARLAALAADETISLARLAEIRASAGAADSPARAAVLAELAQHAERLHIDGDREADAGAPGQERPRMFWPALALPPLVLAAAGAMWWWESQVPSCTDSEVLHTLNAGFFSDQIRSRVAAMLSSSIDLPGAPRVGNASEIGYASGPRIRACKASLNVGGEEVPYAFTIEPAGEDGEYLVLGAHPVLAATRFAHIDKDGNFANKAEPLGRQAVADAMRAGVAGLGSNVLDRVVARRLYGRGDDDDATPPPAGHERRAWERRQPLAEVEPLGPCRQTTPGKVVSCPLMFERHEGLAALLGGGPQVYRGEFTFTRAANGAWTVSEGFAEEYRKASVVESAPDTHSPAK